jgi:DNA primase
MGRIPEDIVEDVLARTDMLQVLQQYVALKRTGANFKGLCPFHNEKTPSFYVHPGKGIYKCFGCNAGGNVYQFVMEIEGWSFPEAVRQLAGRIGVEIPEETAEETEEARKRADARKLYTGIMDKARRFYEEALWHPENEDAARARAYLTDRGIGEEISREFGLGYAPPGWQNLLDHMTQTHHVNSVLMERAGMALTRQGGGGYYDRFRDRVMFPVIDIWGNTLAFGGRVLPGDDGPKYINSSETKFYVKGRQLFGLHAAKRAIQKEGWAMLVEGNFDVISLHAAGVSQAVAPMGTSFTDRQAKLLKRYASKVYIAFDGDNAGAEATVRCIQAMEYAGIEALVVRFEVGDDPDTYVRTHGVEAFKKKIELAEPLIGWSLERILGKGEQMSVAIEERVKLVEQISELMKYVKNPVVWRHYAEDVVARRLDLEPRLVKRYLKKPEAMRHEVERALTPNQDVGEGSMTLDKTEFMLLAMLLKHPTWLPGFLEEQLENLLKSAELARFLHAVQAHITAHDGELHPAMLLASIDHPAMRSNVAEALAAAASDRLYDGVAQDKIESLEDRGAQAYQDFLRTLKFDWAERSLKVVDEDLNSLDMSTQREQWVETYKHKQQLEQFRQQHAANYTATAMD